MSMARTYMTDSGLIAIGATGATPALYVAPTATNDLNFFKMIPSIEAGGSVPTVPSNSSIQCTLNKVTGTKAGGAAVTPAGPMQNLGGLAANTVFSSGSTALTGLTQSTEVWSRTIPFAIGSFRESDEENTNALEINIPASGLYCFYFTVPVGPGAGSNCFLRFVTYHSE
jgi:hypothetical protein